jgi:thermostable 8-oxoguanine DNA glycosylase
MERFWISKQFAYKKQHKGKNEWYSELVFKISTFNYKSSGTWENFGDLKHVIVELQLLS